MEKAKNSAYFYEACILNLLARMGYLTEKERIGIIKIAAEDYEATIIIEKNI